MFAIVTCLSGVLASVFATPVVDPRLGGALQSGQPHMDTQGATSWPQADSKSANIGTSCQQNCAVSPDVELVVVRPFARVDLHKMIASFDRWKEFPPCPLTVEGEPDLAAAAAAGDSRPLRADLVLFGSMRPDDDVASALDGLTGTHEDNIKWRKCFGNVFLMFGNLTAEQDVYIPDHAASTDVVWNIGPNEQFLKLAEWMSASAPDTLMYLMEHDSVPIKRDWLTKITNAAIKAVPFSVLGSEYLGPNWIGFRESLPPALRHHLNGNALYNTSHPVLNKLVSIMRAADELEVHPSFDVWMPTLLLEELGVSEDALADSNGSGYKITEAVANFASSMITPASVNYDTMVVLHGSRFMQAWPLPGSDGSDVPDWWPARKATAANIQLVITDWDEGDLHTMVSDIVEPDVQGAGSSDDITSSTTMTSTTITTTTTSTITSVTTQTPRAGVRSTLPFDSLSVVTTSRKVAKLTKDRYGLPTVSARSWRKGGSEWDICEAEVTSEWFILVDTHHAIASDFSLMVDVAADGTVRPLAPYTAFNSSFCRCTCKQLVLDAQVINPEYQFNHQYATSVIHKAERDLYCAEVTARDLSPSINGYFAFVHRRPESRARYTFYSQERFGVTMNFVPPVGNPEVCPGDIGYTAETTSTTASTTAVGQPRPPPESAQARLRRTHCTQTGGSYNCNHLPRCCIGDLRWCSPFGECWRYRANQPYKPHCGEDRHWTQYPLIITVNTELLACQACEECANWTPGPNTSGVPAECSLQGGITGCVDPDNRADPTNCVYPINYTLPPSAPTPPPPAPVTPPPPAPVTVAPPPAPVTVAPPPPAPVTTTVAPNLPRCCLGDSDWCGVYGACNIYNRRTNQPNCGSEAHWSQYEPTVTTINTGLLACQACRQCADYTPPSGVAIPANCTSQGGVVGCVRPSPRVNPTNCVYPPWYNAPSRNRDRRELDGGDSIGIDAADTTNNKIAHTLLDAQTLRGRDY